jgi:hypothetical protein
MRKNTKDGARIYCAAEMKRCQRQQPLSLVALVPSGETAISIVSRRKTFAT